MAKRWTQAEDDVLRTYYADSTIDSLLQLLPGRTVAGIQMRAFLLRLSKSKLEPTPKPPKPPKPRKPQLTKKRAAPLNSWEVRILLDFGSVLNMPELRALIPRKSIAQLLDAADDYNISLVNREYWQAHVDRASGAGGQLT